MLTLGNVAGKAPGLPHDGPCPLHRLVRWLVDDASELAPVLTTYRMVRGDEFRLAEANQAKVAL